MRIFFVFLFVSLLFTASGLTQEPKDKDHTMINRAKLLDDAPGPIKLSAKDTAVTICNTARSRLIGYRTGCVVKKERKLEIVRHDERVEQSLEALTGCVNISITHVLFPFPECSVGKLAIIEASLEGLFWKLPDEVCPSIFVSCPDDSGETSFTVTVRDADPNAKLSYRWTVTRGEIISGQGTTKIVLKAMRNGSSIGAYVEVSGLPSECANQAGCTTSHY